MVDDHGVEAVYLHEEVEDSPAAAPQERWHPGFLSEELDRKLEAVRAKLDSDRERMNREVARQHREDIDRLKSSMEKGPSLGRGRAVPAVVANEMTERLGRKVYEAYLQEASQEMSRRSAQANTPLLADWIDFDADPETGR